MRLELLSLAAGIKVFFYMTGKDGLYTFVIEIKAALVKEHYLQPPL